MAGDIRGIEEQIGDGAGNILGTADTLQGVALDESLLVAIGRVFILGPEHHAGRDAVDADLRPQFFGEGAGESQQTRLRDTVGQVAAQGNFGVDIAYVDDGAAAFPQMGRGRLRQEKGRAQMHGLHRRPVVRRDFAERGRGVQRSVVDEAVEMAKIFNSRIYQASGGFRLAEIAGDQEGFGAILHAQLLHQSFGLCCGSLIMQGELAALRRELAGNGGAHPAGGASDENDFSGSFQEVSMRVERPDFLTHSHGGRKTHLPVPDADALVHSAALLTHIRQEIDAAGGMISFRRYMELALYTPGLGYYMAGQTRFGAAGDFVTAPEMGRVLAAVLARTLQPDLGPDGILEFGGGSGALAGQIREILPDTPYTLLEPSPDLQARQHAAVPGIQHRQTLPEHWRGVLLAHEVLDAMPVQVLELDAFGQLHECGVHWNGEALEWALLPPPVPAPLAARLAPYVTHWPRPYRTEINLTAESWLREVATRLDSGAILLIDYGHEAAEFYHPQRQMGSLRAYYRHHWLDDPFYLPGLCDLTAHVDFTALMTAAVEAGLEVAFYGHLARFLVEHGLAEVYGALCAQAGDDGIFALNNEIKRLTLPQEMGESFKVLILIKRENV